MTETETDKFKDRINVLLEEDANTCHIVEVEKSKIFLPGGFQYQEVVFYHHKTYKLLRPIRAQQVRVRHRIHELTPCVYKQVTCLSLDNTYTLPETRKI